jgi:hypothetical protein
MLTTEALVSEVPEQDKTGASMAPGMDPGMGGF